MEAYIRESHMRNRRSTLSHSLIPSLTHSHTYEYTRAQSADLVHTRRYRPSLRYPTFWRT
jgi:hypothetical protein